MKTISKKIVVYIFVGLLVFSSTSTIYYRSVHAFEWVGGALAFEEALKWALALLGITSVTGMTNAYWEEYGDEFVDYATENGATQAQVTEWQMKLCEGVLDKASDCWGLFKSWAKSLINDNSGSGSGTAGEITFPCTLRAVEDTVASIFNFNITGNQSTSQVEDITSFWVSYYSPGVYTVYYTISSSPITFHFKNDTYDNFLLVETADSSPFQYNWFRIANNSNIGRSPYSNEILNSGSQKLFWNESYMNQGDYSFIGGCSSLVQDDNVGFQKDILLYGIGNIVLHSDFQGIQGVDVDNLDVISKDLPDESNPEVSIPMPGLGVSDNSISSDAYDDIIDAINNGEITIDKGIEDILDLLGVISYDTDTDDVIPPRPDPEDPTKNVKKDDVINDNKNNMGFTLAGLENVFPFCIPWDIYAFMTLLVADPVAPEFDFPIKSVNNTTEEIHVDLAPFEPVAVVVRYIFDFLFIIGLAMLTRSLIGGGSSD